VGFGAAGLRQRCIWRLIFKPIEVRCVTSVNQEHSKDASVDDGVLAGA
jgi:hypothetical protein